MDTPLVNEVESISDITEIPREIMEIPKENKVPGASEKEKIIPDVPDKDKIIPDVPDKDKIMPDVPDKDEIIPDVPEQHKTITDMQAENKVMSDVSENNEIIPDVPEENTTIRDATEENIISGMPEEKKISSVPENMIISDVIKEKTIPDVPKKNIAPDVAGDKDRVLLELPEEKKIAAVEEEKNTISDAPGKEKKIPDVSEENDIKILDVPKEKKIDDIEEEKNTITDVPEKENKITDVPEKENKITDVPEKENKISDVPKKNADALMETAESEEREVIMEFIDDRVTRHKKPLVGYRMADDSYDSDSSPSVSSDEPSIHLSSDSEEMEVPVKETGTKGKLPKKRGKKKDIFEVDVRTRGELTFEELPPLNELTIDVDPKVRLMEVGAVSSIIGLIIIVQSKKMVPALDQDTILFNEDRKPIGQVFETFGPVHTPLYVVRFNSEDDIKSRDIVVHAKIFYAPSMKEYTRFVFVEQLKQLRGSDASWEHNNEPPDKHLDYSDDEAERKARHKVRGHDDEAEEASTEPEKKLNKRKARHQNNTSESDSNQQKRSHQTSGNASWPTSRAQPPPPGVIAQWPPTPPPGGVGYRQGPAHPSPSSNRRPGSWGGMGGHRPHQRPPPNTRFPPPPPPPPMHGWRPTGGFRSGWQNPRAFNGGGPPPMSPPPPPPGQNSFAGAHEWPNPGGFTGVNQWLPPNTPAAPNGTVSWPPNSSPGSSDAGHAQQSPQGTQMPPLGPMDMRFVQNLNTAPPDLGPNVQGMGSNYPVWNAASARPPPPPPLRPSQFGGPPSFSSWGSG